MENKTVLVADDEQLILSTMHRDLSKENFSVLLAENGKQAVELLRSQRVDVVVTDLQMPVLDGFQVLKEAKRQEPGVIVIILTAHGDTQAVVDALRLGADDFLHKPCDKEELLYRISNSMVKQEMKRTIARYERLLPLCMYCKKIRNDRGKKHGQGDWHTIEEFFSKVQQVHVSHGCCPDCSEQLLGHWQKRK